MTLSKKSIMMVGSAVAAGLVLAGVSLWQQGPSSQCRRRHERMPPRGFIGFLQPILFAISVCTWQVFGVYKNGSLIAFHANG